jgi:hypothetical protein
MRLRTVNYTWGGAHRQLWNFWRAQGIGRTLWLLWLLWRTRKMLALGAHNPKVLKAYERFIAEAVVYKAGSGSGLSIRSYGDIELDEEATANLAGMIARNDAARERAGLTEQEAAAANLEAARRALRARRKHNRLKGN